MLGEETSIPAGLFAEVKRNLMILERILGIVQKDIELLEGRESSLLPTPRLSTSAYTYFIFRGTTENLTKTYKCGY